MTTDVDQVPPRRRARSTDVASRVALLASIPLASRDDMEPQTSTSRRQHKTQTVEVLQGDGDQQVRARQSPTLTAEHTNQAVDVERRCRSVSFDDDVPQSPNTEESK